MRWANVLLILLTFFAYLAPHVNPLVFWPISLLGLIYPLLLGAHLFFIAYWLYLRRRYALFSICCLMLGSSLFLRTINLNTRIPTEEYIRVLTFNTMNLQNFSKKRVDQIEAFASYIPQFEADIIALQEHNVSLRSQLDKITKELGSSKKPYYHYGISTVNLYTRYPILDAGKVHFVNASNGCIYADLNIKGKTVRVYNLHLKSNKISTIANKVAAGGSLKEKETWSDIREMFAGYKRNLQIRTRQTLRIQEHIKACPYPVILLGDFNDVPQSYIYTQFIDGFQDAFVEQGCGIGTTFAGKLPLLRIDYILSTLDFEVHHYQRVKDYYSDHYPIFADLRLK